MLESCYRPLERCFGYDGSGGGGDGLLWDMGLKPHASGDYSIAVVQANSALENQGQVFKSPSTTFVNVYDGHGGLEASRFITHHLFPFLHSYMPAPGLLPMIMPPGAASFPIQVNSLPRPPTMIIGSTAVLGAPMANSSSSSPAMH